MLDGDAPAFGLVWSTRGDLASCAFAIFIPVGVERASFKGQEFAKDFDLVCANEVAVRDICSRNNTSPCSTCALLSAGSRGLYKHDMLERAAQQNCSSSELTFQKFDKWLS